MKKLTHILVGSIMLFCVACDSEIEKGVRESDLSKDVQLITDFGTIVLRLSDETPIHRNNFIKLVNEGAYDSVLFHRVIENFLIQTGDMATKPAVPGKKDSADWYYTIDAEFRPGLLHKRSAVNAARMGDDQNPEQASDGTQFTIIQGRIYNDSTLNVAEKRINNWLAYNKVVNEPEHKTEHKILKELLDKLDTIYSKNNSVDSLLINAIEVDVNTLKTKFDSLAKIERTTMKPYRFPEAHREIYKTVGGAAHLDQNYTVFGEVLEGMDVVDSIARVKTYDADKPINDVRILSATMIERK